MKQGDKIIIDQTEYKVVEETLWNEEGPFKVYFGVNVKLDKIISLEYIAKGE